MSSIICHKEVRMDYANIILEMLDRIKKLEQEVTDLKQLQKSNYITSTDISNKQAENHSYNPSVSYQTPTAGKRDTTRYMFEGNVYLKNRLVLAVVKAYVAKNTSLTRQQLKQVFDKTLQGSIGVVENIDVAELRSDYEVRFFTKPAEIIHLIDGDMYVCTQWGILNIPNFIKRAQQLGFQIEPIK